MVDCRLPIEPNRQSAIGNWQSPIPSLLVSVRSAHEAELALAGGAGLIDVKEPKQGSLGRAATGTIAAVLRLVSGGRPVSAALGELLDSTGHKGSFSIPRASGLAFGKWGLAGCAPESSWRRRLACAGDQLRQALPDCRPVAVAYADWQRARAPDPWAVAQFNIDHGWDTLLVDTWGKDGKTLLDWLALDDISRLRFACAAKGIRLALAGSLGLAELATLLPLAPHWFAVRGAVCRQSRREASIDVAAVRHFVDFLKRATVATAES